MNEYDSARIADLLTHHGLEEAGSVEDADLIILNTCAVREKAEVKLYHQLGRWKGLKKNNPAKIFAVGGCVASETGKQIRARAPIVDIIFGPQTYHRLPEMIQRLEAGQGPQIDVSFPQVEKFDYLPKNSASTASAYVTIMEGCSNFCTYCIVPYTRGKESSRKVDDILYEIYQLVQNGVKEIHLLGQNVNSFQGLNHDGSICSFAELLYLVNEIDGIERIRFTTSNPIKFTQDIINAYRDLPKIVNSLHLPAQSGSDRILKLMGRPYTSDDYRDIIRRLRMVRPDISISSDFIVGFPSETRCTLRRKFQFHLFQKAWNSGSANRRSYYPRRKERKTKHTAAEDRQSCTPVQPRNDGHCTEGGNRREGAVRKSAVRKDRK